MAKLLNGPLAASLRGSIGNLTFLETKFGQVVQTKPVPPVHTTAPALLTKDRFRTAMAEWRKVSWEMKPRLRLASDDLQKVATQQWVSSFYTLQRDALWSYPDHYNTDIYVRIENFREDGFFLKWDLYSNVPYGDFRCTFGLYTPFAGILPVMFHGSRAPGAAPQQVVWGLPLDVWIIEWPWSNLDDDTLGVSAAAYLAP